jgi:hypothetical protein
MRPYFFNMLMIAAVAALQGCGTSQTEARFLRDHKVVTGIADSISEHPPRGFEFAFRNTVSASRHTDLQSEERNIRDYMNSSGGWEGNSFRQAVYRPATGEAGQTNTSVDAAMLFEHYFGMLERAGFRSGVVGSPITSTLKSMEVASRSWSNRDRTLIVLGQVITDRDSGEAIVSVHYWGTLNYRPH